MTAACDPELTFDGRVVGELEPVASGPSSSFHRAGGNYFRSIARAGGSEDACALASRAAHINSDSSVDTSRDSELL